MYLSILITNAKDIFISWVTTAQMDAANTNRMDMSIQRDRTKNDC